MRFFAIVAALVLVSPIALAGEAEEKVAAARTAFETGAAAAAEERWGDALAAFTESAALRPHATTDYNIGFCERALARPTRAKKFFAKALAEDGQVGELTPERRAAAQKYLAEVKAQIAMAKLTVQPEVTVAVDGRPLEAADAGHYLAGTRPTGPGEKVSSTTITIEVDGGSHEIVVRAPDGRTKIAHEVFKAGGVSELIIELPAAAAAPTVVIDHGRARRTAGYILGAVGLVGLGLGTYFGLSAGSKWSEATDMCPSRVGCSPDAAKLSRDAGEIANLSTVAFVAGGAAIVGGTILILTGAPPTEKPRVGAAFDPRGAAWLTLTGSF